MAFAATETLSAHTEILTAADGAELEAYVARPGGTARRGGVLVVHHLPGYDAATKEITRRFAALGFDAICVNLYSREAPGADPDDAAAAVRAQGGVPDDRFVADMDVAARYLRALPEANGKVGVIGYCSGGRHSVLAACSLQLDAAVDCYGAFVVGTPPESFPLRVGGLEDKLAGLSCPLLGLFGEEDKYPSPEQVADLDQRLTALGKPHEFHSYPGAGHAFFSPDRPSYRQAAAVDGWGHIARFFATHLS